MNAIAVVVTGPEEQHEDILLGKVSVPDREQALFQSAKQSMRHFLESRRPPPSGD